MKRTYHMSDCGLHNGPACRPTHCDCGAELGLLEKLAAWVRANWLWVRGLC
jgi:hypothetical protein